MSMPETFMALSSGNERLKCNIGGVRHGACFPGWQSSKRCGNMSCRIWQNAKYRRVKGFEG